jgi:hypothetical protein
VRIDGKQEAYNYPKVPDRRVVSCRTRQFCARNAKGTSLVGASVNNAAAEAGCTRTTSCLLRSMRLDGENVRCRRPRNKLRQDRRRTSAPQFLSPGGSGHCRNFVCSSSNATIRTPCYPTFGNNLGRQDVPLDQVFDAHLPRGGRRGDHAVRLPCGQGRR